MRTLCPRMLSLPPDCVAFCAKARCTPMQLLTYITNTLRQSGIDPWHYDLAIDWCCMTVQPVTGVNGTSSTLSFAMLAIMGSTEHLHEWAHNRLSVTLPQWGANNQPQSVEDLTGTQSTPPGRNTQHASRAVDPSMLAHVTAAVVVVSRPATAWTWLRGAYKAQENLLRRQRPIANSNWPS